MRFLFVLFAAAAVCQVPPRGASPQVQKEWELGRRSAADIEHRDGRITDPAVFEYLQRIEKTVAIAAGIDPAEVRVTRSAEWYLSRQPRGVLYISGGLLARIENEAELAGLLAHDLAHAGAASHCVLASPSASAAESREVERRSTEVALGCLKADGYDPAGLLDLLSKLANEHPAWAPAIVPDDLLALRAAIEAEPASNGGWRIDSSAFRQVHATVLREMTPQRNGTELQRRR